MGSAQSNEGGGQTAEQRVDTSPKIVRIERTEIPEEYRTVGVSHDVVDRILSLDNNNNNSNNTDDVNVTNDLRQQLAEEREMNHKLREQIRQLTESKYAVQKNSEGLTLAELEERKRAFEETLERIEKQYFSYHPENICKAHETDLMECIKKNRNKLLNCSSFALDLKKCAGDFREKVLKEMPKSTYT